MTSSNEPSTNSRDTLAKVFRDQVEKYQGRVALRYKKHGIWKKISWTEY